MKTEFLRGLVDGIASPFSAICPDPIKVRIPEELQRSSYVPRSEDMKNIAGDFSKVIARVRPEISAKEQKPSR